MTGNPIPVGELVTITSGEYEGYSGVVSWPVAENGFGYVLICHEGNIAGVRVFSGDVKLADASSQGFSQLSYHLLKLSSFVIEKSVLPATRGGGINTGNSS